MERVSNAVVKSKENARNLVDVFAFSVGYIWDERRVGYASKVFDTNQGI